MSIQALIDGDWILYAAGFAGQRTELVCPGQFEDGRTFRTMTEMKAAAEEIGEVVAQPVYSRNILDPEEHFYHSAKKMIEGNCNKVAEKFNDIVRPRVIMDGDGNFRSQLATIRPYKGTRSVHAKPLMYNQIRQYLLDCWDAEVVFGQETDDEMAIIQTEMNTANERCVIVAVDKDMLQVPGWHLNPNKGFKYVTDAGGLLRLYIQAAQGDAVDNIAGAYKVGPKAAQKAFAEPMNETEMWLTLYGLYDDSIIKHGNQYNELSAEEAALENMRLVYLRRERDELWKPPGV